VGAVLFYHLTRSPLEQLVRSLLTRALGEGWRVALRGGDTARLAQLDHALWLGPEEVFLPHGRAGGPHDADQPILLTEAAAMPNGAVALMLLDGAALDPAEAAALERVWLLFEGEDDAALSGARAQWRQMAAAGLALQYWSEAGGRWEKTRESAPAPQV